MRKLILLLLIPMVLFSQVRFWGRGSTKYYVESTTFRIITADTLSGALLVEATFLDAGTGAFVTSATSDTVVIAGVVATSVFVVSINDATPAADDLLSWDAITGALVVYRVAGTTSALAYSYLRVK